MRYKHILITGGAGFIGSHLADELIRRGYAVRIFDNLENQVHPDQTFPQYLNKKIEFIQGDVRNIDQLRNALDGMDVVFHEAAAVGVGQSQYEIKRYVDVNVGGTANLLDILVNTKHSIQKVITTTSMTGYGEGNYLCGTCGIVRPSIRTEKQLQVKDWELHCPRCDRYVQPAKTDELAQQYCTNMYALTKKMQEDMILSIGQTYRIPVVALRCFNVYGPRQSLSNPYTGVTAIFISRLKNNQPPKIYEDGLQSRDFVSVYDVVDANMKAMEDYRADYHAINIGSGKPVTIKDIALVLAKLLKKSIRPIITEQYRKNDIRHCLADIAQAKKLLQWRPKISFSDGIQGLISWAEKEQATDQTEIATKQLEDKGLTV